MTTVLSIAYPFAPVGPNLVGGAEQILCYLDQAVVKAGDRSLVVACEGSMPMGRLFPVPLPERESLEEAKQTGVDGYEVQPDRVVFYLWPSAGGSKFQFIFRPRFGISAMSAPSVLYDYYNPEANAAVLPLRFNVQ